MEKKLDLLQECLKSKDLPNAPLVVKRGDVSFASVSFYESPFSKTFHSSFQVVADVTLHMTRDHHALSRGGKFTVSRLFILRHSFFGWKDIKHVKQRDIEGLLVGKFVSVKGFL
jgi:hypothetical protein